MRGMISSVVLGSLMMAIVVGFALYLHTGEVQKERTAISLAKQMEEVRGADILRYYVAALERSYYSEALLEKIAFLSSEEVKQLESYPLALVPTEGYDEYLKDLFNGALRATVDYIGNPPVIRKEWYNEFPELDIQRNATLKITFTETGTVYSIPLTDSIYVLPVPLRDLGRLISRIKTIVKMDVYVGFYTENGELRYRTPTRAYSFGGSTFEIRDRWRGCVPEDGVIRGVEKAKEAYLENGLVEEIERRVGSGIPGSENAKVKDINCIKESLLVLPVVDTNQGFPAGFEAKTVDCKAIIELNIPGGKEVNVVYPFRVKIEDTFNGVPKRRLDISLENGYYTLSGICP